LTFLRQCPALDVLLKEIVAAMRPDAPLGGLGDAVERVRERVDLVQSHLRFLRSTPEHLAEVAQRAYWHVNGFLKVRLATEEGFCLRLHIWPPGANRRGDAEPHGHRWDFASWVAIGSGLAETYFGRTDGADPAGSAHVLYEYGRPADRDALLQPGGGVVWLRPEAHHQLTPGSIYDCGYQMVHTVAPCGTDLLATVLLQGPTKTTTTPVYRPFWYQEFRVLERSVETDELAALIGAVEEALAAPVPV